MSYTASVVLFCIDK